MATGVRSCYEILCFQPTTRFSCTVSGGWTEHKSRKNPMRWRGHGSDAETNLVPATCHATVPLEPIGVGIATGIAKGQRH
jgi:hypothetical protein